MERVQPSVFARDDTFFGVCEALGEDLRIPPNLLRVGFALALFFNPVAAIGVYAGLGVFVAVLRWFVPNPRVILPEPAAQDDGAAAETETSPEDKEAPEDLAIAA